MNKITDLIEDALKCDDYKFRINFMVAGFISEEANDTKEKIKENRVCLREIAELAKGYKGETEKEWFMEKIALRIQEYLDNTVKQ